MNAPRQLDAAHYTQGEPFMREKAQLFAREWLPICAASQLTRTGDYLGHVIGGWPIVAVRAGDRIRVLRNTCRHQSMMVLDKPSGNCTLIQCRYHGWQYQLDGAFVSAPPLVAPAPDAARAAIDLVSLATHHAAGMLFGHLDDSAQAPPLDEAIMRAAGAGNVAPDAATTLDIGCNWKVFVEYALANQLAYQWPLLALRRLSTGAQWLQIIPRSFLRTRIVSYVTTDAAASVEEAARALELDKSACEALQARYAQGELSAALNGQGDDAQRQCTGSVEAFRRRVLQSLAE